MITTIVCDDGHHDLCRGECLVLGVLRPANEPDAKGRKVWVTVACGCQCHAPDRQGGT